MYEKKRHFLGDPNTRVQIVKGEVSVRAACGSYVEPSQLVNRQDFKALGKKERCKSCTDSTVYVWRDVG